MNNFRTPKSIQSIDGINWGELNMYKKNNRGMAQFGLLGLLLVVGVAFLIGMLIPKGGNLSAVGDSGPADTSGVSPVCSSTTTPQVTFSAYDEALGSTATADIEYKINNGALAHVASGTSITNIKPNDKIEYIAGAGTYYNISGTVIVPCNTAKQVNLGMKAMATSPTLTVINSDGLTTNSGTNTQSLGANDAQGVTYKIQGSANQFFQGVYLVLEYNASAYKVPLSTKSLVDTPGFYVVNDTSHKTSTFYIVDEIAGSVIVDTPLTLRTIVNPGTSDIIESCAKDSSWYVDEMNSRAFKYGASDENQAAVGQTCAAARTKHIFVA